MNFELQFDPHRIPEFEARYSYEDDTAVLEAGRRIRAGAYTRQNLQVIYDWKTGGRGRSRLAKNDDAEIADALRLACLAATDRAALAVLTGLHGVDVPVASAVLWAVAPERFTIIDFRALEALGVSSPTYSVGLYLAYLAACRRIASEHHVALRVLDRALWQWSKERAQTVER